MSMRRQRNWRTYVVAAIAIAAIELAPAAAQQASLGEDVIDLTADGSIEWLRDSKAYVAKGNARVRRNDMTIYADRLILHYRDKPGGGSEVWRYEMHGDVKVVSDDGTVSGDDAAYESDSEVLVVTGTKNPPTVVSEDTTLTASETIEYWETKDMAVARGNAKIVDEDRTLWADIVTAHYRGDGEVAPAKPDGGERSDLKRSEAFGNVKFVSDDDVLRADKVLYDADADMAQLFGSVRITSGDSQLNGDYGEYDLDAKIGRITGGGSKRVHGLFKTDD
ncbi:MAG: hypothetical protein GY791_18340 [Alphaproteobacteria bacterium]|nr:hypothetical protein [Alphaproteobacteria bacterium]